VSQRLPAVRPRQLIRVLERKGWRLDRTSGSHQVFVHDVVRHVVVVPMHNKDLGRGLLARILQDAEIPRDEFLKLL
jgi:predicted RNA binding protein YcfA (HicA-like mRNA interferase family)